GRSAFPRYSIGHVTCQRTNGGHQTHNVPAACSIIRPRMPQPTAEARAQRFLGQEEAWARRVLTRSSLAWWTASISGKPRDYARMERADRAVNRHYSRPVAYGRLVRLS